MSGEWSAQESMDKIQSFIEKDEEKIMKPEKWRKFKRDFTQFMGDMADSENIDSLMEKEYHFDEKSGVSLKQHIKTLKE